jgi:hypothetical protein
VFLEIRTAIAERNYDILHNEFIDSVYMRMSTDFHHPLKMNVER